jgi:hypothetical protein
MQPTRLTITPDAQATFVAAMTTRMAEVARQLSTWVADAPRTLAAMEEHALALTKDLGQALLAGTLQMAASPAPAPQAPCTCGRAVPYERPRTADVLTVLGLIRVERPIYWCRTCGRTFAPFDAQTGLCPGSISAGLDELLALLGAREDSFDDAAEVLQRLTLVRVCANLARTATERLGRVLAAAEQATVAAAWAGQLPPLAATTVARLYVSVDGLLVHTHAGWKECKLGAVYTTVTAPSRKRPEKLLIRAHDISYVGDITTPETLGRLVWTEAARRGVLGAVEVIAIGDGAHWIWNLIAEHFPRATQIVDWYHASQYIWAAANAVYGEGTDLSKVWAGARLDELWAGDVRMVLTAMQATGSTREAVSDAISYLTTNQDRMRYAEYRARGIQIGSGVIESGCKHVIGARLKQAGMIWNVEGARAVGKVRTWLKGRRWAEAMALRPPLRRASQREAA